MLLCLLGSDDFSSISWLKVCLCMSCCMPTHAWLCKWAYRCMRVHMRGFAYPMIPHGKKACDLQVSFLFLSNFLFSLHYIFSFLVLVLNGNLFCAEWYFCSMCCGGFRFSACTQAISAGWCELSSSAVSKGHWRR